ncbi:MULTISPECIES: matrixin family metalloprotease [unclassified Mesorhizobium]|uniref:matrixin family metalloprotease n=1 Tax=unclassified Mesorhizobium TaxID=325217 RepID=UPI0015E3C2D9|nr:MULTISPECIES: matrixin family metalloprotease [unclassified Mesorhizobium]UCI14721.1 matrixin family metalloprotease [Mesorhizobium sp. B2-1-1]
MDWRSGLRNYPQSTLRLRSMLLAAILTFGSISSNSAAAYEVLGWDWKYQANPIETHFVICENDAPAGASKRIKEAAAKWNYAKLKFVFDDDDCPANPPLNYVEFGELKNPSKTAEADTPNIPATTKMKRCKVRFNKDKFWYLGNADPGADENDLFSVALHEFGHCLGLDHVKTKGVVMQEQLDSGKYLRELAADDLAGRNKIYGAP